MKMTFQEIRIIATGITNQTMHSFVVFVSNLNAEWIIDTCNVPAKTKMEYSKKKEGMYNIFDFQLMGGLSKHTNGGPGGSMSCKE